MKIYDLLRYGVVELQGALWAPCFILSSDTEIDFRFDSQGVVVERDLWNS